MEKLQADLAAKFDSERQLNKGGTTLTYIPAPEVITRLNTVLDVCGWSQQVIWLKECGEHDKGGPVSIVAHVRLRVHHGDKQGEYDGLGGQIVNRKRDGSILDIGDDYKGACSDALKKAAQCVGIGLYLARDESLVRREEQEAAAETCLEGWADRKEQDDAHRTYVEAAKQESKEIQDGLKGIRKSLAYPWPMSRRQFDNFMEKVTEFLKEQRQPTDFGSPDEVTQDQLAGAT